MTDLTDILSNVIHEQVLTGYRIARECSLPEPNIHVTYLVSYVLQHGDCVRALKDAGLWDFQLERWRRGKVRNAVAKVARKLVRDGKLSVSWGAGARHAEVRCFEPA